MTQKNTVEPDRKRLISAPLWRLLSVQFIMNASHFMAMPVLAIYCSTVLNLSLASTGAVLSVYFIASRATPVFIAPVVDRYSRWNAVIIGLLMRGLGFLGIYYASGEMQPILFSIILGLGTSIYEAGAYGTIGSQREEVREKLIIYNVQFLSLACVAGPIAGAGLALIDFGLPLLCSAVLFFIIAGVAFFENSEELRIHTPTTIADSLKTVLRDKAFIMLCIVLLPWWAIFAQLFAAFPLEATARGENANWANAVIIINGIFGFLALFITTKLLDRFGVAAVVLYAVLTVGLSVGLIGMFSGLTSLLILVAIFTCAEVSLISGTEILVGRHAVGRSVSTYFAMFNMSWGLGGAIGGGIGPYLASSPLGAATWPLFGAVALFTFFGFLLYSRGEAGNTIGHLDSP